MVDAYRQPYIPFYLATREFFELVRDRLAPGGVVIVNAGHPEDNDDLEQVLGRTMSEVFPSLLRDPIEDTNTLLVGQRGAGVRCPPARRRSPILPPGLRDLARREAARLGPRLPGGSVYTDDRAPVEWLIDRSILGYAADDEWRRAPRSSARRSATSGLPARSAPGRRTAPCRRARRRRARES